MFLLEGKPDFAEIAIAVQEKRPEFRFIESMDAGKHTFQFAENNPTTNVVRTLPDYNSTV